MKYGGFQFITGAWRGEFPPSPGNLYFNTSYRTVFKNCEWKFSERIAMQSKSTSVSVLRLRKLRSGSSLQSVLPKCPVARFQYISLRKYRRINRFHTAIWIIAVSTRCNSFCAPTSVNISLASLKYPSALLASLRT